MASFMPAAWSPWAIDQAIERLFATPKTTALRPCRSKDMSAPWKGKDNSGRLGFTTEAGILKKIFNIGDTGVHRVNRRRILFTFSAFLSFHAGFYRPTRSHERQHVHTGQNGEGGDQ